MIQSDGDITRMIMIWKFLYRNHPVISKQCPIKTIASFIICTTSMGLYSLGEEKIMRWTSPKLNLRKGWNSLYSFLRSWVSESLVWTVPSHPTCLTQSTCLWSPSLKSLEIFLKSYLIQILNGRIAWDWMSGEEGLIRLLYHCGNYLETVLIINSGIQHAHTCH